jgi:hypothetical protein
MFLNKLTMLPRGAELGGQYCKPNDTQSSANEDFYCSVLCCTPRRRAPRMSRRYDLDCWFVGLPEAINHLEGLLRFTELGNESRPTHAYSVAGRGERLRSRKPHAGCALPNGFGGRCLRRTRVFENSSRLPTTGRYLIKRKDIGCLLRMITN